VYGPKPDAQPKHPNAKPNWSPEKHDPTPCQIINYLAVEDAEEDAEEDVVMEAAPVTFHRDQHSPRVQQVEVQPQRNKRNKTFKTRSRGQRHRA
jgi:hypothetical protein